jgi:hypothetical protein
MKPTSRMGFGGRSAGRSLFFCGGFIANLTATGIVIQLRLLLDYLDLIGVHSCYMALNYLGSLVGRPGGSVYESCKTSLRRHFLP